MKKAIYFLVLIALVSSCAPGPIGAWNYTVTGTPEGDFAGVMEIAKKENGYSAKMKSRGNETPFNTFQYSDKTKKAEGTFDYSGTPINFQALLDKDQLNGAMSAGGMDFPFKATRKKNEANKGK
jgi:hypothetical protein